MARFWGFEGSVYVGIIKLGVFFEGGEGLGFFETYLHHLDKKQLSRENILLDPGWMGEYSFLLNQNEKSLTIDFSPLIQQHVG